MHHSDLQTGGSKEIPFPPPQMLLFFKRKEIYTERAPGTMSVSVLGSSPTIYLPLRRSSLRALHPLTEPGIHSGKCMWGLGISAVFRPWSNFHTHISTPGFDGEKRKMVAICFPTFVSNAKGNPYILFIIQL